MANILELLNSNLTSDVINQFSDRLGADKQKTETATEGAVNILLAAINKEARKGKNTEGLINALQKDHSGNILDNINDFALGRTDNLDSRTTNGAGILNHLLGSKRGNAVEMLTKTSGLDKERSGSLLEMLAPVVMGAVGRQMTQSNADRGGLMDILQSTMNSRVQNKQEQSMLEKLLDQDNDGSILDDLLNIGLSFLRRKR
ncbi:MAG: DUF937 domain-containing protein [Saprospiraceae bacterium]|nr:DUF937 domain-containing protein [Saprospiraceae bacterium]